MICRFFFFNDTATTEIYTLSLHDALPISRSPGYRTLISIFARVLTRGGSNRRSRPAGWCGRVKDDRSEEHTSELQSRQYLVCRLLLEKKKTKQITLSPATVAIAHSSPLLT